MKKARTDIQAIGARRLRRFGVRMVLRVREALPQWTLKRAEGRVPILPHDSTLVPELRFI